MIEVPEFQIATMDVRDGDVIVLKSARQISIAASAWLGSLLRETFPRNRSIILEPGFSLEVVRRAADEEMPAVVSPLATAIQKL